jgi:hypothetical protein
MATLIAESITVLLCVRITQSTHVESFNVRSDNSVVSHIRIVASMDVELFVVRIRGRRFSLVVQLTRDSKNTNRNAEPVSLSNNNSITKQLGIDTPPTLTACLARPGQIIRYHVLPPLFIFKSDVKFLQS